MSLIVAIALLFAVQVLAATTLSTSTTTTTTATASTQYAVPTYSNPVVWASPKYNVGSMSRAISVSSKTEYGQMVDPDNTYTIYRDGGGSCTLYNRTFFIFDDTTGYKTSGALGGFATNSIAMARDFSDPTSLKDFSMSDSVGYFLPIPMTTAEATASKVTSKRYAFWTYTNCVQLSETSAAHFFLVNKYSSSTSDTFLGNTVAQLSINPTTNVMSAVRYTEFAFDNTTYPYGSFASMVVNGVAYLYGLDATYSSSYDVHVASVPVGRFWDSSKYQYWDASTSTWSYTQPIPTARRQSSAAIQGTMPFSSGTVFYSEYHNQYLLIFFNRWIDSTFRVITAPTPLGPWNITNSVLWKTTSGASYNYGGVAHPVYGSSDGSTIGQSLKVHFSYQDDDGTTYPKIGQITFK
ncbi:hypothetical protein BZA70DRAFT_264902 [Myxozyma melibiosi]|uniref:DUF4185 domain-containing protein n=1 Tax=Myxozyma melibiosi TaxID=54550 RepID=A0ABR1FEE1_9ASCO